MVTETWAGNNLVLLKECNLTIDGENTAEYTEVWTGNVDDGAWPSYTLGGTAIPNKNFNVSHGTLKWYSLHGERGSSKALGRYEAKASDKFDSQTDNTKARWTLEYESYQQWENVGEGLYSYQKLFTYSLPILTKVTWYTQDSPPSSTGPVGGASSFPSSPFDISIPSRLPTGWEQMKTQDGVSKDTYGWARTEVWKYGLIAWTP